MPRFGKRFATCLIVLSAVLLNCPVTRAAGEGNPSETLLAEFRIDPLSFFFDLRATDALKCGQVLLQGTSEFSPQERENALTALAAIYLATGRRAQARAAFLQVLDENPRMDLADPKRLPPPLINMFYSMRDSLLRATGNMGEPNIHTIAIGDIENHSIVTGKYDMDHFALGLQHIITTDLRSVTPLKIVDRQRLNTLKAEIDMSRNEDIMDPRYAVPLGKLCGAQSFLFGSIMQVDKKKIRLDLRWVDTSTSEVLLSEGLEVKLSSSDDLFDLERTLLLEILVPRIEQWLARGGQVDDLQGPAKPFFKEREGSIKSDDRYVDFLIKSGEAMLAEEVGNLPAAAAAWAEVRKLRPDDSLAEDRVRAIQAQLALANR